MPQIKLPAPFFEEVLVADNLRDGYWIEAVDINGDGRPDLVASGLAVGDVVWYENPSWEERPIASFPKPVAMHHADVDGDGRMDLVVCHDYGSCMYNCRPEDGKISWLKNPGSFEANGSSNGSSSSWDTHFIADLMATHRLLFGFFTQEDNLELMAFPVVGPEGVHEPTRVMLYPVPEDPAGADGWDGRFVDGSSLRVVHGLAARKFGSRNGSGLDSLLVASEEGVSWLYHDEGWHNVRLGEGETGQAQATGFKGTGNVAVGRIGDDPYAYIATVEPFHGNTIAVYTKDAGSTLTDARWKRTILDVYGDPNDAGEGPGHHVVTADFDGDGDDEFLVALRGPWPWQGVFYYKAIDVQNGLFVKRRVSTASAARIAVGDFDGDGRPDFATTGYYTPGYFLADDPKILVFLNGFADVPAT